MTYPKRGKNDLFMIFEMERRAKLLNQLAHLQLLQRCAASCRRGRASRVLTADLLQKSGVLDPPAAPTSPPESQDCANKLLFVRSLSHSSRSLARALTSPQSSHDRLDPRHPPALPRRRRTSRILLRSLSWQRQMSIQ